MKKMSLNALMGLLFVLLVAGCTGTGLTYHTHENDDPTPDDLEKEGRQRIADLSARAKSAYELSEAKKNIRGTFNILEIENIEVQLQKAKNPKLVNLDRGRAFAKIYNEFYKIHYPIMWIAGATLQEGGKMLDMPKFNSQVTLLGLTCLAEGANTQAKMQRLIRIIEELTSLSKHETLQPLMGKDSAEKFIKAVGDALNSCLFVVYESAMKEVMRSPKKTPFQTRDFNLGLAYLQRLVQSAKTLEVIEQKKMMQLEATIAAFEAWLKE